MFLFESAYYWFAFPLTVILALLPRYLAKAWRFGFYPDDIATLRYISKVDPDKDLRGHIDDSGPLGAFKHPRPASMVSHGRTESVASLPRPSMDFRSASRTDMSTGIRSVHRGFDFATEENGVAMQRMQTNLSERRQSSRNIVALAKPETGAQRRRRETISHVLSVPRNFLRRKGSTSKEPENH